MAVDAFVACKSQLMLPLLAKASTKTKNCTSPSSGLVIFSFIRPTRAGLVIFCHALASACSIEPALNTVHGKKKEKKSNKSVEQIFTKEA
jgi:hypothetical protein